jgi:hypothetical protein
VGGNEYKGLECDVVYGGLLERMKNLLWAVRTRNKIGYIMVPSLQHYNGSEDTVLNGSEALSSVVHALA